MTAFVFYLFCSCLLLILRVQAFGSDVTTYEILPKTEAFFFSMKNHFFNSSEFVRNTSQIKYRPTLLSMPDLPHWMKFTYSDYYEDGYIYGVPDTESNLTIEVIATKKSNFQTSRQTMNVVVIDRNGSANYEVQMKFSNLNLEDIFQGDYLKKLLFVFKIYLWENEKDNLYITLVESAIRLGGRRPTNPKDKDGVIVRIGAPNQFSDELRKIALEVEPARNREYCPKDYIRTSVEHHFRHQDFTPDWCGFRLITTTKHTVAEATFSPIHLTSDDFKPPRAEGATRSFLLDFLLCIILPTTLAFVLAAALSFIMFGRREGVEKRNRETPSIQMVQYASIHRASNNLRTLASKRNGSTPSALTPSSTLPRSCANSPTSTLVKNNPVKKPDERATLIKSDVTPYGFPGHILESPQKTVA